MYTFVALLLVAAFFGSLGALSFRFTPLAKRLVGRLRDRVLGHAQVVAIRGPDDRESLLWFRVWAAVSAAYLLVAGVAGAGLLRNVPDSIPGTVAFAGISMGVGALAVAAALAVVTFVPRARGYATLARHGFRAFWLADPQRPPRRLVEEISSRAQGTSSIRILDVTGFDLIGKGPGATGGILYDTLAATATVPVQLLLLEPETRALDPEQKHATVFQTALAEMETTPATYQRRVRATLDAVDALNETRPAPTKIAVRFYAEKPAFRALVFDDASFVGPWTPIEGASPLPFLEVVRDSGGASLHEGFRRQMARMWRAAAPEEKEHLPQKPPTTVVRRRPVPEAVSA